MLISMASKELGKHGISIAERKSDAHQVRMLLDASGGTIGNVLCDEKNTYTLETYNPHSYYEDVEDFINFNLPKETK